MTLAPSISAHSALLLVHRPTDKTMLHRGPLTWGDMVNLAKSRGRIADFQFLEVATTHGKIDDSEPIRDITVELIEWLPVAASAVAKLRNWPEEGEGQK